MSLREAQIERKAHLPGFLAPPPNSPPYYGFPVLEDVVDGFTLGMIPDWEAEPIPDAWLLGLWARRD
jgi:hypothetical protein